MYQVLYTTYPSYKSVLLKSTAPSNHIQPWMETQNYTWSSLRAHLEHNSRIYSLMLLDCDPEACKDVSTAYIKLVVNFFSSLVSAATPFSSPLLHPRLHIRL
jgi:uncharacterized protein YjaZ